METKFIRNAELSEIAEHLKWLCNMGDILPPSNPKEFVIFLKLTFGKYDIKLIKNASQFWAAGNLPSHKPIKQLNMFWISTLLNAYLDVNGRLIPTEQPKYLSEPKNDVKIEIDYDKLLGECKDDIKIFDSDTLKPLYFSRWAMCFNKFQPMDTVPTNPIREISAKIISYNDRYYANISSNGAKQVIKQMAKNYREVSQQETYRRMIEDAACFYVAVKQGKL